jgi:hypothetical protein
VADWNKVEEALQTARGIAWDTCHKIYVLMDDEQMAQMVEYEYDPLIYADTTTPAEMLDEIIRWYEDSCALRFVEAVTTNPADPNLGFVSLISQFEDEEDEDEDEDED